VSFEIVITLLVVAAVLRRQDRASRVADGRAHPRIEGRIVSLDTEARGTCG